MKLIKQESTHPIGGDEADKTCNQCGSEDTIYEEYGTSESDDSELGVTCNTCENAEFPEEGYIID